MGRAPCCDKANVKKGPWSPEEDAKLKAYIEEHGTGGNWIALPHKIGLKRCGKSCRLRWLNYLRPNIKHGAFSEEEDRIICGLYISIGSRWSIIAAQLPGRTDNDIKNYWNTRLKKKLLGKRRDAQQSAGRRKMMIAAVDQQSNLGSSQDQLSSSALERLRLHMQLQGFNNNNNSHPLCMSFYNNPLLWPKLNIPADNNNNGEGLHNSTSLMQPEVSGNIGMQQQAMLPLIAEPANMQEGFDRNASSGLSNNNAVGVKQLNNSSFGSMVGADVGLPPEFYAILPESISVSNELDWWTPDYNNGDFTNMDYNYPSSSSTTCSTTSGMQPDMLLQEFVYGYGL